MIKTAFQENDTSCTQVFEWLHHFENGSTSLENDEHLRHPAFSRNDNVMAQVHDLVRAD
jgi:hypothetical protein